MATTYGIFEIALPENTTVLHESWNHIESMKRAVDHLPRHHQHHHSFTELFGQLYLKEKDENKNLDADQSLLFASSVFTLSPSSSLSSSDLSHDDVDFDQTMIKKASTDHDHVDLEQQEDIDAYKFIRCESKRSRERFTGEFPPPLSCMGKTGKSVWLQSVRQDGRFILTQVRIPTPDFLHAYRENGRLKLHYFSSEEEDEDEDDEKSQGRMNKNKEEKDEEESREG